MYLVYSGHYCVAAFNKQEDAEELCNFWNNPTDGFYPANLTIKYDQTVQGHDWVDMRF